MDEAKIPNQPANPIPVRSLSDASGEDTEKSLCCPGPLSCILASLFPCAWCCSCTTVREKTELVLLNWGRYVRTIREPGLVCWNPFGVSVREVSTASVARDLKDVKVADARGNPLLISGVVTYRVANSRRAALDVQDHSRFVDLQALSVLKNIASRYPYESRRGDEPSLKSEAEHIKADMRRELQHRSMDAGVEILNFEITDLAYSTEIARQMLIRQQAEAMVDARKTIVAGAVDIAHDAINALRTRGVELTQTESARLVSNLLITIVGESSAQPTISMN